MTGKEIGGGARVADVPAIAMISATTAIPTAVATVVRIGGGDEATAVIA